MIRLAREVDGDALAAIYAPAVDETPASFEYTAPNGAEMASSETHTLPRTPWLVAEREGAVLGYAYAGPHRERAGYQWDVNVSVYIAADWQRRGVGRALYTSLFAVLRLQGRRRTVVVPKGTGMEQERREQPRRPVKGVEALSALLPGGEATVLPLNLSGGGMCCRWTGALPEGEFPLIVELPNLLQLTATVAWQRALPDGTVLAALQFVSPPEGAAEALEQWLATMRRSVPRWEDFLPVEVMTEEESFSAVASDLSLKGLQIHHDAPMPEGTEMMVLLPLQDELLELHVIVRWNRTENEGSVFGVELVKPTPALERHIRIQA